MRILKPPKSLKPPQIATSVKLQAIYYLSQLPWKDIITELAGAYEISVDTLANRLRVDVKELEKCTLPGEDVPHPSLPSLHIQARLYYYVVKCLPDIFRKPARNIPSIIKMLEVSKKVGEQDGGMIRQAARMEKRRSSIQSKLSSRPQPQPNPDPDPFIHQFRSDPEGDFDTSLARAVLEDIDPQSSPQQSSSDILSSTLSPLPNHNHNLIWRERILRLQKHLTYTDTFLAQCFGVHRMTISGWRKGLTIPQREVQIRMVEFLVQLREETGMNLLDEYNLIPVEVMFYQTAVVLIEMDSLRAHPSSSEELIIHPIDNRLPAELENAIQLYAQSGIITPFSELHEELESAVAWLVVVMGRVFGEVRRVKEKVEMEAANRKMERKKEEQGEGEQRNILNSILPEPWKPEDMPGNIPSPIYPSHDPALAPEEDFNSLLEKILVVEGEDGEQEEEKEEKTE